MSADGGWIEARPGRRRQRAIHWFPIGEQKASCGFSWRASGDKLYDWRGTRRVCSHCDQGDRPEPWW